jgi:hypothetical protein
MYRAYKLCTMPVRKSIRAQAQRVTASAARGMSWMSLVAATTLGVSGVDQLRARVSTESDVADDGELRLIVQSYRRDTLDNHQLPSRGANPLASIQRAITIEELRHGVDVSVLQVPEEAGETAADSVVVAWVESGSANLEFEGMEARPGHGAYYGAAQRSDGAIVLRVANG